MLRIIVAISISNKFSDQTVFHRELSQNVCCHNYGGPCICDVCCGSEIGCRLEKIDYNCLKPMKTEWKVVLKDKFSDIRGNSIFLLISCDSEFYLLNIQIEHYLIQFACTAISKTSNSNTAEHLQLVRLTKQTTGEFQLHNSSVFS